MGFISLFQSLCEHPACVDPSPEFSVKRVALPIPLTICSRGSYGSNRILMGEP